MTQYKQAKSLNRGDKLWFERREWEIKTIQAHQLTTQTLIVLDVEWTGKGEIAGLPERPSVQIKVHSDRYFKTRE